MNRFKRPAVWVPTMFFLATILMAQTDSGSLNSREARQELEVMENILATTAKFALAGSGESEQDSELHGHPFSWRQDASVGGFYLYGQGTVFLVRVPGAGLLRHPEVRVLESQLRSLERSRIVDEAVLRAMEDQLRSLEDVRELREEALRAADSARQAAEALRESHAESEAPPPPAPPRPPGPPKPPAAVSEEDLKVRVEELRERLAESREEQSRRQEEFQKRMSTLEENLVEAVARHGSSLRAVKAGQYINLILIAGDVPYGPGMLGSDSVRILSMPRQAIDDFSSGKINLEALRQKVIGYES